MQACNHARPLETFTDVPDIWTDIYACLDSSLDRSFNNYHMYLVPFSVLFAGPECIPCELPVFDQGVLIACNHNQGDIISSFIGGTGLKVCDNGFHKDSRGECKRVYIFSNSLKPINVEPREIEEPKKPRNLRKYLQSINRFN